jgi:hypothetical protein
MSGRRGNYQGGAINTRGVNAGMGQVSLTGAKQYRGAIINTQG